MNLSPWMIDLIQNYGFWALMLVSFIAATILPFSSAASLFVAMSVGMPISSALIACSIGNSAGCAFNYGLGYIIGKPLIPKLEKSKGGRKAIFYTQKYGTWSLLVTWTPILGDPITIAAGIFRINIIKFAIIVFSLRIIGYCIIAAYFLRA